MSDEQPQAQPTAADPEAGTGMVKGALPSAVTKRGIDDGQWRTLCLSLYPGANPNSVLLVWDYCKARQLDPMKKPVHIVPMRVKNKQGKYEWRDVVLPGIYEYRTTAHRTGEYLGHSEPQFGPEKEHLGVTAPEWCAMTIYRFNNVAKQRVEFPVRVFFNEVVGTAAIWQNDQKVGEKVNDRWSRAPKQMLVKCCEAAGIREAFPEEIGGEPTAEEMDGREAPPHDGETVRVEVVSPLEKISEGLRKNIEIAFERLGLSAGARMTRVNEFLGANATDEGAEKLLTWCKDEIEKRKAGTVRQDDNGRKPAQAQQPPIKADVIEADPVPPTKTQPTEQRKEWF